MPTSHTTCRLAFGNGKYYDAHTGAPLGTLPFPTTVYALNPAGDDFWAYDPATTTVSFRGGQTRANNAIAAVSSDGTATLAVKTNIPAAGSVDVVVDVVGFFR